MAIQSNEWEIKEFIEHLEQTTDDMLENWEDEKEVNVTIILNNKKVTLGHCAETYHSLMSMLNESIE